MNAIIDNADKLKKYSIFNKAGSFSYANILQTARDFERVKNVILPEDEYKGVQAYTTYYYSIFLYYACNDVCYIRYVCTAG